MSPFLTDVLKVVNLQGRLKTSKRQTSELHFDFSINSIGAIFGGKMFDLFWRETLAKVLFILAGKFGFVGEDFTFNAGGKLCC
jgi:hypothetical protein